MKYTPKYKVFPKSNHDESSRESFCRVLGSKLASDLRPKLKSLYEKKLHKKLFDSLGREPNRKEIAKFIRSQLEGKIWYRLRTDNQDRMYNITFDTILRESKNISKIASKSKGKIGSMKLNSKIKIPSYLKKLDIHRRPGGYHSQYFDGDISAGAHYDKTISIHNMGSHGLNNDDPGKSIALWIKKKYQHFKPKNILDLGCTIGSNTLPYKEIFPESNVFGIDISAPCIRYAHARACELNTDINFVQDNAERTFFPSQYFDLITSRILLHETSNKALKNIILECKRLLKPNGIMIHSDAPQFEVISNYDASLRDWDAICNNEPFMTTFYSISLKKLYSNCGFNQEKYIQEFIPSIYINANKIEENLTPSFRNSYFVTGAVSG